MIENNSSVPPADGSPGGLAQEILWLLKGFVYPCWSREYYRGAAQRRMIAAIAFLVLFAFVQTAVTTIRVAVGMNRAGGEIRAAYERGEFPNIRIDNGVATVEGRQPLIFSDQRQFFAIDTTGAIEEIDTRSFSEGFLLTRTEIHFVNEDGYQVFDLAVLHDVFGNPIVLDRDRVLDLWAMTSLGIGLLTFIGVFLWNSIVRFAYIALLGLVIWGVVSIFRQGVGFSPVLITGIYATVPTVYIVALLKQVGVGFFSFFSLLLIVIWAVALLYVLKPDPLEPGIIEAGSGIDN